MAINYDDRYERRFDNRFDNGYVDLPASSGSGGLRLADYLRAIVRGRRTIITITLIALALGGAYAFLAPPVYRADVLFHVEDKTANASGAAGGGLASAAGGSDTKPSTAAQIELLKSRLVVEEAVRTLHLDITATPRYLPVVGARLAALANGHSGFRLPSFVKARGYAWGKDRKSVV